MAKEDKKEKTEKSKKPESAETKKSGLAKAFEWLVKWAVLIIIVLLICLLIYNARGGRKQRIKSTDNGSQTVEVEKESGTSWALINNSFNLGQHPMDADSKKNGEKKKIELSTTKWCDPIDIDVGKSFTPSFRGKVAVMINRNQILEHNAEGNRIFLVGKDFSRVKDSRGKEVRLEDYGDQISEIRFMSLDEEGKLMTVTIY